MGFVEAIETVVTKSFDFEGRASRSEFWYWMLFYVVGSTLAEMLDPTVKTTFVFATILPTISVTTRRLHDTNHSGWWQLLTITIIGFIPYLYWVIIKGDRSDNRYGSNTISNKTNPAGNYQSAIDDLKQAAQKAPARMVVPRPSAVPAGSVTFGKR